jgi:hypothetical protein
MIAAGAPDEGVTNLRQSLQTFESVSFPPDEEIEGVRCFLAQHR